jgi:hypothetical protein
LYEAIHCLDRSYSGYGHRKDAAMINGAHAILYSDDAEATRATWPRSSGPGRSTPAAAG